MGLPGLLAVLALPAALVACGSDPPGVEPPDAGADGPVVSCGLAEVPLPSGCEPVGVPKDGCGPGFLPDDRGGCDATMPPAPCGPGTIATPGDVACRELGACGTGTWGDIADEPGTQYVDGAFTGASSDGSKASPWKTIDEALTAVASGGQVAIAAGAYAEDVLVSAKRVRVRGRCAAMVEIGGSGSSLAVVEVLFPGASASAISDVAVTGALVGVAVAGATDVRLERVWIHDTDGRGLDVVHQAGATGAVLSDALIEGAHQVGLLVAGAEVRIERSVVRATQPDAGGVAVGIFARPADDGTRGSLTLSSSVVEETSGSGIVLLSSDGVVDGSLIRDIASQSNTGINGEGIIATDQPGDGGPASLSLTRSIVERASEAGVAIVGATATIDATVIRATRPQASDQTGGLGLLVQWSQASTEATVRRSLIDECMSMGVFVASARATLEAVLVRGTKARDNDGLYGDGVLVASYPGLGAMTQASLSRSRVEASVRAGVSSFAAQVTIAETLLECNGVALDAESFEGQPPAFSDLGANTCACAGEVATCTIVGGQLAPPPPL